MEEIEQTLQRYKKEFMGENVFGIDMYEELWKWVEEKMLEIYSKGYVDGYIDKATERLEQYLKANREGN